MSDESNDEFFYSPIYQNTETMCLDYPQKEVAQYWEKMIPNEGNRNVLRPEFVSDYIFHNPFFKDFFEEYLSGLNTDDITSIEQSTKPETNRKPERKKDKSGRVLRKTIPYPCELEPFFRDYISTVIDNQSKKAKQKDSVNQLPSNFNHEFVRSSKRTFSQSPDVFAYYKYALYADPAYCGFVAEEYWHDEFDKRCQILKETVQACPPELRLQFFLGIIRYLDANIAAYSQFASSKGNPATARSEETSTNFLMNFPAGIIKKTQCRIPYTELAVQNSHAEFYYMVPNVSFCTAGSDGKKTMNLKDFFDQSMKRKQDASLTDAARKAYLSFFSTHADQYFPKTDFLKLCETLDQYLATEREPYDKIQVQNYAQTIARCSYNTLHCYLFPYTEEWRKYCKDNFLSNSLAGVIQSFAESFYNNHLSDIYALRLYRQNRPKICEKRKAELQNIAIKITTAEDNHKLLMRLFERYTGKAITDLIGDDIHTDPITADSTILKLILGRLIYFIKKNCYSHSQELEESADIIMQQFGLKCLHKIMLSEWKALCIDKQDTMDRYISTKSLEFPFCGTTLHYILFTMKLYMDLELAKSVACRCFEEQYKTMEKYRSTV